MDPEEMQALQEEQQELMEEQMDQAGFDYPGRGRRNDSLFGLFRHVLNIEDSSKVGNLDMKELGMLPISVRECQRIGLLSRSLKHPTFGKFLDDQSQITLRTSASKKGWFTELFVSQKKFTSRASQMQNLTGVGGKKKWKLFGQQTQQQQPPMGQV